MRWTSAAPLPVLMVQTVGCACMALPDRGRSAAPLPAFTVGSIGGAQVCTMHAGGAKKSQRTHPDRERQVPGGRRQRQAGLCAIHAPAPSAGSPGRGTALTHYDA